MTARSLLPFSSSTPSVPGAALAPEATSLVDRVEALAAAVDDDESYRALGDALTTAVEPMIKRVDSTFDPILERQREALAETRRQRDMVRQPLLDAKTAAKAALGAYHARLLAARERVDARIREEAARRALAAAASTNGAGVSSTTAPLLAPPTAALAALSRVERPTAEGVATRVEWKLTRVLDARALRLEFLVADERKIRAVVKTLGPDSVASVSLDSSRPAVEVERVVQVSSRARG